MEQHLEELLIEKPFTALNVEERQYALERLTKEEYEQCRRLLLGTKMAFMAEGTHLDSTPKPDQVLIDALKARQKAKDTFGLRTSRRKNRRIWLAAGSLVIGFAILGALWLTFRQEVRGNVDTDIATHYLKNGMDQKIVPIEMPKRSTNDSVTNGYLLTNDSLFRALDAMNDYMVIQEDRPRSRPGQDP